MIIDNYLRYVERYADPDNYNALTYENTLQIAENLAPLSSLFRLPLNLPAETSANRCSR